MTYLLDVNALLALGHSAHVHHPKVAAWVAILGPGDTLATCSTTELGFVLIAPQTRLSPSVGSAHELPAQIRGSSRPPFVRLVDDLGADSLSAWADAPAATTNGHLSALATHGASLLATFDEGIPDLFLIPS